MGCEREGCVRVSRWGNCIDRAKGHRRATRIPCPQGGHGGDGNFHVVFSIDPDSPEELAEVEQLSRKLIADALEAGGTCTGEHGIGIGKLRELEQEQGEAIHVMRAIKTALDPLNIMNPGKVLQM